MAIPLISLGPKRMRVGFVGAMPSAAVEALARRGYEAYQLTAAHLSERYCFELTGAIVLTQEMDAPRRIREEMQTFSIALNHDCRVYLRFAPNGEMKNIVLRALNKQELPPSGYLPIESRFFYGKWFDDKLPHPREFAPVVHLVNPDVTWEHFGNLVARNDAGPAPNTTLDIEVKDTVGNSIQLEDEADLLIRRAFHNCDRVCLFGKGNGQSGVGAYEAYAYLAASEWGGKWPYKFFVKLGERVKVVREFQKYGATMLEHVPFHLGPRLRPDRCVLGRSHGLIVSDFVLGAETICEAAREGRGVAAIANLFNITLLPWRRAANPEIPALADYVLKALKDDNNKEREVPKHRADRLPEFRAKASLGDLCQIIKDLPPSTPVLTGMVHGDLHATNVLVRGHDAVIIDLERVGYNAPLIYDAASLEAGLFVDGFIKDPRSAKEILESILHLYDVDAFEKDDHLCDPSNASAWFMDCVRQIRMQAKQMELTRLQYALMLGAAFLRKASNPDNFAKEVVANHQVTFDLPPTHLNTAREAIRTLAFTIGEKIILGLSAKYRGPST